jgi:hypothetical protein
MEDFESLWANIESNNQQCDRFFTTLGFGYMIFNLTDFLKISAYWVHNLPKQMAKIKIT